MRNSSIQYETNNNTEVFEIVKARMERKTVSGHVLKKSKERNKVGRRK